MGQGPRVVCFGECMLELQGQAFGEMRQTYGGDTLNTAVYLARCGAAQGLRVDYATALGDDPLSTGMIERWQAEGVGTELVRRLPGRLPGLYLIEVAPSGERSFSYWRDRAAARDHFDTPAPDTPLERAAGGIDALYISGISLAVIGEAGRERLLALLRRLRADGRQVVFDNNYRPRLWSDRLQARRAFDAAMDLASIALVTLDDEMALSDETDSQAVLAALAARGLAECVVKRGAQPTLVSQGSGWQEVPTERVPRVVDTTAAGDSFAAGYLAARLGGVGPAEAARAGNRLAARVVQHRGAVIPRDAMADLMVAHVDT